MSKINKNTRDIAKKEADLRVAYNALPTNVVDEMPTTLIKRIATQGNKSEDVLLFSQKKPFADDYDLLIDTNELDDNLEYKNQIKLDESPSAIKNGQYATETNQNLKALEQVRASLLVDLNAAKDYSIKVAISHQISSIVKCIEDLNQSNPISQFKNESSLEFTDISSEEYRIYEFNNGKTVMISEPLKLNVAKSGGHRIFDGSGISHYIPQ